MEIIFKLLNMLVWCGTAIAIVWGLAALLIRAFRMPYGTFIYWFSYLMGTQLWLICAALVHDIWGIKGLVIGILLFGVGVVPLALLAALIHGAWSSLVVIILSLGLIFLCRWGGHAIFDKEERRRNMKDDAVGNEMIGVKDE